jgi:hypothetical protein
VRKRNAIPVPLFVGLVIGLYGSLALSTALFGAARSGEIVSGAYLRWSTFDFGCSIAAGLLVSVSLFAVAHRTVARTRVLVSVAAWTSLVAFAWYLGQHVLLAVAGETGWTINTYVWYAVGTAAFGGMICLALAARAFARPSWVTTLAVLGLVASALGAWPVISGWLSGLGGGLFGRVLWPLREAMQGTATIALVYAILRDAPDVAPDLARAARGFSRAGHALAIRVVAAVGFATLALGMLRSWDGLRLLLIGAPAFTVISLLGFAWGVLDVERAGIAKLPRLRLTLGAAIAAWYAGIVLRQAGALYTVIVHSASSSSYRLEHETNVAEQWMLAGPLVALAGILLVISAISSLARSYNDHALRAAVSVYGSLSASFALVAEVVGFVNRTSPGPSMGILVACCSIASLVTLAKLMWRAAQSIGGSSGLPEARLRP